MFTGGWIGPWPEALDSHDLEMPAMRDSHTRSHTGRVYQSFGREKHNVDPHGASSSYRQSGKTHDPAHIQQSRLSHHREHADSYGCYEFQGRHLYHETSDQPFAPYERDEHHTPRSDQPKQLSVARHHQSAHYRQTQDPDKSSFHRHSR